MGPDVTHLPRIGRRGFTPQQDKEKQARAGPVLQRETEARGLTLSRKHTLFQGVEKCGNRLALYGGRCCHRTPPPPRSKETTMGHSVFPKITHPKKRAFLTAYSQCGILQKAAALAQCNRTSHYHWKHDPDYAEAFALAREMVADLHEDEASRRAMGWDETRYTDDGTPYTIRKYSDTLLIVRLKALKPDEYRENTHVNVEGVVTLQLEERTRQANDRIARLRRIGADGLPA